MESYQLHCKFSTMKFLINLFFSLLVDHNQIFSSPMLGYESGKVGRHLTLYIDEYRDMSSTL